MRNLLVALTCCIASAAWADLTLVTEIASGDKPTRTVTLSVKGPLALFELNDGAVSRSMLRDSASKKMFAINHEKKEVVVITEGDSKALEARQAQFREQMRAQLEKLPPEKRARIEATMLSEPGAGGAVKPVKFTYEKKKTPARKVGGYACQDYAVKRDGAADGEGCFTTWKELGLTAKDFKAVMENAMPNSNSQGMMAHVFDEHETSPGFPVYRVRVDAAGVKNESTVKSFTKTAVAAEKFEVPKGYTERAMGDALKAPPKPAR